MEQQLVTFKQTCEEVAALREQVEHEMASFSDNEEAWRQKIEEFAVANEAWAAKCDELEQKKVELETLLGSKYSGA